MAQNKTPKSRQRKAQQKKARTGRQAARAKREGKKGGVRDGVNQGTRSARNRVSRPSRTPPSGSLCAGMVCCCRVRIGRVSMGYVCCTSGVKQVQGLRSKPPWPLTEGYDPTTGTQQQPRIVLDKRKQASVRGDEIPGWLAAQLVFGLELSVLGVLHCRAMNSTRTRELQCCAVL